jgi:hypothetical protein
MIKTGQQVSFSVETTKSGHKHPVNGKEPSLDAEVRQGTVINYDTVTDQYMVKIDDDLIGWTVGKFYILYSDVNKVYLNKKFYSFNEEYLNIVEKTATAKPAEKPIEVV